MIDEQQRHFPADATRFAFDKEVSAIFPDMAKRAIPNFYPSHAAHARMLKDFLPQRGRIRVLDIGASRGAFFEALEEAFGVFEIESRFDLTAIDNSPDMCAHIARDFPRAAVHETDVTSDVFLESREKYDVVCLHYVLQFLPPDMQYEVLLKVTDMVKPGGVLIYGHKSSHYGALGSAAHDEYIRFRVENGYTEEEIKAKTAALKGSMTPMSHASVLTTIDLAFSEVQETFRFMMFSTLMAVK